MGRFAGEDRDDGGAVADLEALPDVARISGRPGQVILYPGHTPPGVFVVLAGAVKRVPERWAGHPRPAEVLDAAQGAFVVPDPAELDRPAACGLEIVSSAKLLFVPRSLILGGGGVAERLRDPRLAPVSLR